MQTHGLVKVVRVGRAEVPQFMEFLSRDAQTALPGQAGGPEAFRRGFAQSLEAFDFLGSDSYWLLAAELEGQYVGYLSAVRIPKVDGRIGVLFVDELMVLPAYRRRGAASALWREALAIAVEIRAWRIRLLVEADNPAARAFYRKVGMAEVELVLCQREPGAK